VAGVFCSGVDNIPGSFNATLASATLAATSSGVQHRRNTAHETSIDDIIINNRRRALVEPGDLYQQFVRLSHDAPRFRSDQVRKRRNLLGTRTDAWTPVTISFRIRMLRRLPKFGNFYIEQESSFGKTGGGSQFIIDNRGEKL
jgi:hypothetical protein